MTEITDTRTAEPELAQGFDGFDPRIPSYPRVWPYLLDLSKDAYPADRDFARALWENIPGMLRVAWSRQLGRCALAHYLARSGIGQIIVAGTDLPCNDLEIHEIAWNTNPATRTVYADRDKLAVVYAQALFRGPGTRPAVHAAPGDADALLDAAAEHVDLHERVAVLFVTSLDLLDKTTAARAIRRITARTVDGSAVGIVHLGARDRATARLLPSLAADHGAAVPCLRGPAEVAALFPPGMRLVRPGIFDVMTWLDSAAFPDGPGHAPQVDGLSVWCAVARTPRSPFNGSARRVLGRLTGGYAPRLALPGCTP
ncbi:SAM-dependent methyltransferase [Actinomadura sp. SCN-SB]|uniref:SAM-dependent methyltransferase n=1 Tax=Actinomadura sp. SCN-SB TaxID=3373092 RepID=UPI00375069C6